MTQQEILSLVMAGYTKADIDAMSAASGATPINQDIETPLPIVTAPQVVQTQDQAQPQQVDFITQLAQIGAQAMLLQKPQAQPQQPIAQPQTPAVEPQQVIAQTPSNSGLTPEEATKLFQAWSRGNAKQDIELPPTADEVLTKRFASLYGADVTKPNN